MDTENDVYLKSCRLKSQCVTSGESEPAVPEATDFGSADSVGNACRFGGPCRLAKGDAYERLRALVAACPMAIVGLDVTGRVEVWNAAAETMFGWKAAEVVGNLLPAIPNDRVDQFKNVQQLVLDGQTTHLTDVFAVGKGGIRFSVNVSIAPMFDAEGNVFGMMSVLEQTRRRGG